MKRIKEKGGIGDCIESADIKLTHECCLLPPLFQLLDCVIFHFHPFILNSLTYTALIFPVKCRAYEPNSPTLLTFTCIIMDIALGRLGAIV